MDNSVRVRVPATSANLGPGYDCIGLALDLWDEVSVGVLDRPGVMIDVTGEGADTVPHDESHLVMATLRQGLVELGYPHPDAGLHLTAINSIPQSRGLGSSAAAVVSGLALAWGLARPGFPLDRSALLTMAAAIEGHPDNAAPAILGGAQLAWLDGEAVNHIGLTVNPSIVFRVYVPDRLVPTALARRVLPEQVDRVDAVHQVLAESAALTDRLRGRGVATVISGAGPTVLALGSRDQLEKVSDVDTAGFVAHDLVLGEGVHFF